MDYVNFLERMYPPVRKTENQAEKMQLLYIKLILSHLVFFVFWHDTTVNETSIPLLVLAFLFLKQAGFPSFDWGRTELGSLL